MNPKFQDFKIQEIFLKQIISYSFDEYNKKYKNIEAEFYHKFIYLIFGITMFHENGVYKFSIELKNKFPSYFFADKLITLWI